MERRMAQHFRAVIDLELGKQGVQLMPWTAQAVADALTASLCDLMHGEEKDSDDVREGPS